MAAATSEWQRVDCTSKGDTTTTKPSWHWHREDPDGWHQVSAGDEAANATQLEIVTAPGSIWGAFGRSNPAVNTLLTDLPGGGRVPVRFEAIMDCRVTSRGQQAGLLVFVDDDNWVKLVIEANSSGEAKLLLGRSQDGDATVVAKMLPCQSTGISSRSSGERGENGGGGGGDIDGTTFYMALELTVTEGDGSDDSEMTVVVASVSSVGDGARKLPFPTKNDSLLPAPTELGRCDMVPCGPSNDSPAYLGLMAHGGAEGCTDKATFFAVRITTTN